MKYYLGIDLGTSSLKVSVADSKGTILLSKSEAYPLLMPKENYTEQNPDDWYNALINALKSIGNKIALKEIKAISFCGQMHGLVILDEKDKVIRPAILWNDSRTIKEVSYLNTEIGEQKLIEETSNIALCGFTLPKILWIKNNEPDNFKRIKKIMLPKDYLVYKITKNFVSDITDLSGTLFFNVKTEQYSDYLLKVASITMDQLPKIHKSYDVVGKVSEEFSKVSGLATDCKVVIGGADQAIGALGTNTINDNDLSISLGTSGTVVASIDNYKADNLGRIHSFRHANGKYYLMGCTLSAANSVKWRLEEILGTTNYDKELNNLSNDVTDIIFLPYLMGERSPINDPHSKGMFSSLNAIHTRSDLTKAVVEGVCFSLFDNFKVMQHLGLKSTRARVIGGLSKSPVVMQILCDIFGIELININTNDGGSLGAIILAMVGDGQFKSVKEAAKQLVNDIKIYKPDLAKHKRYLEKFFYYKKLYYRNF